MRFQQLIDGVEYLSQAGDAEVTGVDYDSRRVKPGYCFVAMQGETTDGNRYIGPAIQKGAVAVVSDSADTTLAETTRLTYPDIAWAQVSHGRRALARVSAN